MREAWLDVVYEIEVTDDLAAMSDPRFHQDAIQHMRYKAEAAAREAGGHLRTDRLPEITVPKAVSPASPLLANQQFVLYASRWLAMVPEAFHGDGR